MSYMIEKLEKKIRKCIEEGLEEGYYLIQQQTYDEDGGFCAAGMCVRESYRNYVRARNYLGLSQTEMTKFTNGFDGVWQPSNTPYRDLYDLGTRLRDYYMVDPDVTKSPY